MGNMSSFKLIYRRVAYSFGYNYPIYRLAMLGLESGGKTTLLYRLKLNEVVNSPPTIGFNAETITHKCVDLCIWDYSGKKESIYTY